MMNEKMIEKLAAKGFNRWTKGKYDRMYINAKDLGLDCDYYKTGNICCATFQGDKISNSEAYRMKAAKTYIDVETGEVVSDNRYLKEAAEEVLEAVKAEIEAEEAALTKETKWAEDAVFAFRTKEDAKDEGSFGNLRARTYEAAKKEIEEHVRLKYYLFGFYDATLYRKTAAYAMDEEGEKEIFESIERFTKKSGTWEPYRLGEVERTTNTKTWRCTFKNIAG